MQFDPLRAFPYPVLRPGVNDYTDSDIQTTADVRQSENSAEILADVDIAVGVSELRALVASGQAEYVVVFSCRDTYFRQSVASQTPQISVAFASGALRGEVLICPYVVAKSAIESFSCKWINREFGPGPFTFATGSVLAMDAPQAVYVDRDSFKPLSSCFVLAKEEGLADNEWKMDSSRDKVQIAVSPGLKARIDDARNSKPNRAILLNSIYFAAVMQCLVLLRDEEFGDYRWAKIFRQRMESEGISPEGNLESWVAQQLMRHPIAILDQYFFSVSAEA